MNQQQVSTNIAREKLKRRFASGRMDLMILIVLTALSSLLLFTGTELGLIMFQVPYVLLILAMMVTGRLPDGRDGVWNYPDSFLYAALAFLVLCLALYVLLWVLSKKHPGALLAAAILYSVDCLLLLAMTVAGMYGLGLIGVVLTGLWIYWLFSGAIAAFKLQKMPEVVKQNPQMTATEAEWTEEVQEDPARPQAETQTEEQSAQIEAPKEDQ